MTFEIAIALTETQHKPIATEGLMEENLQAELGGLPIHHLHEQHLADSSVFRLSFLNSLGSHGKITGKLRDFMVKTRINYNNSLT